MYEYIVGIISGIIANSFYSSIKLIFKFYNLKKQYMFLKHFFNNDNLEIIISHHGTTKGDLYKSEKTILVRIEEVLSLFYITDFFRKNLNNNTKINIHTSNISVEELKNENFISLGSTINNELLEKLENVLSKKGIPLRFNKDSLNITINNEIFSTQTNNEKKVIKDYGILIKTSNPYSKQNNSLFCLGITGFSTLGIVSFITDKTKNKLFEQKYKNIINEETICVLFEFEIDNDLVSETTIKYVFTSSKHQDV